MQLSADQMRVLTAALNANKEAGSDAERRRTARCDVNATANVRLVEQGVRGKPIAIPLADLSPRGVALLHTEPLAQGQQFVLTLRSGTGPDVAILCTVVHSRWAGAFHKIGAEFTCALNPSSIEASSDASPGTSKGLSTSAEQERIRDSVLG